MYEKRHEQLIDNHVFLWRLVRSFLGTLAIVGISLGGGTLGYSYFGELPWDDALLNAAMILTGMGPVNAMRTTAGKLFSTFYALYSGLAFLSMVAIILAPVLHRFMHRFHLDESDLEEERKSRKRN
ncbi:MAG: hypothetical protein WCI02_12295 [Planctomycetota bacterium]|jgi:hypothetical protein